MTSLEVAEAGQVSSEHLGGALGGLLLDAWSPEAARRAELLTHMRAGAGCGIPPVWNVALPDPSRAEPEASAARRFHPLVRLPLGGGAIARVKTPYHRRRASTSYQLLGDPALTLK